MNGSHNNNYVDHFDILLVVSPKINLPLARAPQGGYTFNGENTYVTQKSLAFEYGNERKCAPRHQKRPLKSLWSAKRAFIFHSFRTRRRWTRGWHGNELQVSPSRRVEKGNVYSKLPHGHSEALPNRSMWSNGAYRVLVYFSCCLHKNDNRKF